MYRALTFTVAALTGVLHSLVRADTPIPFPHPQITEVLFNVPTGDAADANRDGTRDAAGDEFVEIANPHDKPINLKGYVLTNRRASVAGDTSTGVRFAFPDVVLPAHAVCVVFNGYDSTIPPPVGDQSGLPAEGREGGNSQFNGVLVFSMKVKSKGVAFANNGDWLLLSAPDGTGIDCVSWGEPDPPPPTHALRLQSVNANPKGSVQRLEADAPLEAHREINDQPFSPGIIPTRTKPAKTGSKPPTPSKPTR